MAKPTYSQQILDAAKTIVSENEYSNGYWYRQRPPVADIKKEVEADDYDLLYDLETATRRARKDLVDDIVKAIEERLNEAEEITLVFTKEFGFQPIGTGGGCEAFAKDSGEGDDRGTPHFLVTDADAGIPLTWDTEAWMGHYDIEGEPSDDVASFDSVGELVEKLRAGTAHPLWKKAKKAPAAPAYSEVDIETINRHRARIGGDPIDVHAGWSSEEIRDMAENIRTKGTEHNPASAALKRKLMR